MRFLLWIAVIVLLAVVVGFSLYGIKLFRKMICRRPYCKAPTREEADEPMKLDPLWVPYREAFQEGKKYFCLADRERVEIKAHDGITLVGHVLWPEGVRQSAGSVDMTAETDKTAAAEKGQPDLSKIKGFFLLMHGFHGTGYSNFGLVLPFYMSLGYAILMPDERAHQESGGDYITFGIKERYDCRDWVSYLAGRFGEDMPIYLDGISMGATVVMMASALDLPGNVRGVIADCGFTSPKAIMEHVMKNNMHLPTGILMPLAGMLCKVMAGFDWEEYSSLEAMKEGRLPVLFLHGRADALVPCYMTEQNFAACTAPKDVMYVEEAGHGLCYLMETKKCQEKLAAFVQRYNPA